MIAELTATLHRQIQRAEEIQRLPAERLLRRPSPTAWNVVEVFEHLVLSSGIYVRGLQAVFDQKAASLRPSTEFRPGILGDFFTRGMLPKPDGRIGWKMRTMKIFDPARQHGASSASIDRFIALGRQLLQLLEQATSTDLNRMKVSSSLGPIIRFKAGDALRFPIAHQQRHFFQIERILAQ